jgi:hypothetical protein
MMSSCMSSSFSNWLKPNVPRGAEKYGHEGPKMMSYWKREDKDQLSKTMIGI